MTDFDDLTVTRDHIVRANLPWRERPLTECGRFTEDVKTTITRDAFLARLAKLGKQRTAFTICMTCATNVHRWPSTFTQNPVEAMRREVWAHKTEDQLTAELRAIAELIAAHPDEFYGYLTGLDSTIDLAQARRKKHAR